MKKNETSIAGTVGAIFLLIFAFFVMAENPTLIYESGHIRVTPAGQHSGKLNVGDDGTLATGADLSALSSFVAQAYALTSTVNTQQWNIAQYPLADLLNGSRAWTADKNAGGFPVTNSVTGPGSDSLTTKGYVDAQIGANGSVVYFRTNASDVATYSLATTNLTFLPFSVTNSFVGVTQGQYLVEYITTNGFPNLGLLPPGVYDFHDHIFGTAAGTTTIFGEVYTRSTNDVETFHFRTENSEVITATLLEGDMHAAFQGAIIDPTDRVVLKVRVNHTGAAANVSLIKEGSTLTGLQFPVSFGPGGDFKSNGSVPMNGALNFGGQKGSNASPGVASSDLATVGQVPLLAETNAVHYALVIQTNSQGFVGASQTVVLFTNGPLQQVGTYIVYEITNSAMRILKTGTYEFGGSATLINGTGPAAGNAGYGGFTTNGALAARQDFTYWVQGSEVSMLPKSVFHLNSNDFVQSVIYAGINGSTNSPNAGYAPRFWGKYWGP